MKKNVWVNMLLWGTAFPDLDAVARIFDIIKAAGGSGAECPVGFDSPLEHYGRIGVLAKECGLGMSAVGLASSDATVTSPIEAVREAGVTNLELLVGRTEALDAVGVGGPLILPWKHRPVDEDGKELTGAALVDELLFRLNLSLPYIRRVAEYAEKKRRFIYGEHLKGWEVAFLNLIGQMVNYVREADRSRLGVLDDTSHETSDGHGLDAYRSAVGELHAHKIPRWRHVSATGQRGTVSKTWIPFKLFFGIDKGLGVTESEPAVLEIFDARPPFADCVCINRREFSDIPALLKSEIGFVQDEWEKAPVIHPNSNVKVTYEVTPFSGAPDSD